MHFLPSALLLLATTTLSLAKPLPGQSLAEIERRWSAGETEVSSSPTSSTSSTGGCRPNAPGCYVYAWFHSIAAFCNGGVGEAGSQGASIHSGTTHRDATPAWPVQRDAAPLYEGEAFSYATDERTMLRAQRRRRSESTSLQAKIQSFVERFYRQRGEKGVIARDVQVVRAMGEEDAAPVLKPRRGMRYSFTA